MDTTLTRMPGNLVLWEQRWRVGWKLFPHSLEDTLSTPVRMFVDHVLPGLKKYWICRQKICSMVCQTIYWIHNNPFNQYRCPACGTQYRPWKRQPGYWTTNMIYVSKDVVTLQAVHSGLAPCSSDGLALKNQVMIVPVMWPTTSDSELIDRIKVMFGDIDRELLALAPKDRLAFVSENLSKTQPHKAFELQEFSATTQATIDSLNANLSADQIPWQYGHIEKNGYFGIHVDASLDLDKPMKQVDFVRSWWLCFWLSQEPSPVSRFSEVTGLCEAGSLQHFI
jgi:hypothetical protein